MTWGLTWSPRALRDLRRLDRRAADRIVSAMVRYAETEEGDALPLHGAFADEWRLRVGDWRVRYARHDNTSTIEVLHVLPRGRAYR